ncbi:MAG: phosphoribosylglycinamide formyltransferase [Sulfurovum sp. AS07-7]|nr:MAG: phosphoribosylglycinamide formyltransferase [Sulfurovum sp. AS07-7]
MKNIAILFSGDGTNFEYLIKNLDKNKVCIKQAICNNQNAKGIDIAKANSINLEIIDSSKFQVREEFDEVLVQTIKKAGVDLVVLAGFMRILTPVFTKNIKAINLHPSLLPRHKGTNAIAKSFYDEFLEGGVSVHYVNDELDGGEIILQREIFKDGLSFGEYYEEIKKQEKEALIDAIYQVLEVR